MTNHMKKAILGFIFIFATSAVVAQNNSLKEYCDIRFKDITPVFPEKQQYDVVVKIQTSQPIENKAYSTGALKGQFMVYGTDSVVMQNVGYAKMDNLFEEPAQTVAWDELNGRCHKISSDDWQKDGFYHGIPLEKMDLARMIVSDMPWFEIAMYTTDSLEFGKDYFPSFMNNFDLDVAGSYTFGATYSKFTWSGVTLHNDEPCAIVKFESLNSRLNSYNADGTLLNKGRDLYYGEILISLIDKQLERFVMVEDVISEFQSDKNLVELQRVVTFNKIE